MFLSADSIQKCKLPPSRAKVFLKNQHYFTEGGRAKCYYHPDDDDLCIKIKKPIENDERMHQEVEYMMKLKTKDKRYDYPFYATYHGVIETNFGVGHVYDLIRDETTQNRSLTLSHYREMTESPFSDVTIKVALMRLKKQMIAHKVFANDLHAKNICCRILADGGMECVVVDGLGHRDFFPVADYFHFFAKKKVERRFLRDPLIPHNSSANRSK